MPFKQSLKRRNTLTRARLGILRRERRRMTGIDSRPRLPVSTNSLLRRTDERQLPRRLRRFFAGQRTTIHENLTERGNLRKKPLVSKFARRLTPQESSALAEWIGENDRLIHKTTKIFFERHKTFFKSKGQDYADLYSIALDATKKAFITFNPNKGKKLSSWVVDLIRQGLIIELTRLHRKRNSFVSLDATKKSNGDFNIDALSRPQQNRLSEVEIKRLHERLAQIALTPRQRRVLEQYFGLAGEKPKSYKIIADEMGMSRENVRLINEKALEKLILDPLLRELFGRVE